MYKLIIKTVGLSIVIFAVFYGFLNYQYFYKNIQYDTGSMPKAEAPVKVLGTSGATTTEASIVEVPSLGIRAPIMYISQTGEDAFQAALKNGVVHYPGTAMPGAFGNCYIFGHSSDYAWSNGKFKTVFALLPKIKIGAEIMISDQAGIQYTYVVTESKVVGNNETQYLGQGNGKTKQLTLQTSYPVGTALKRFLAIAELRQ